MVQIDSCPISELRLGAISPILKIAKKGISSRPSHGKEKDRPDPDEIGPRSDQAVVCQNDPL